MYFYPIQSSTMRIIIWLFIAVVFFQPLAIAQNGNKGITLEDLFKTGTFRMKGVPGFNAMAMKEDISS
jgi:hypothetical protein